MGRHMSNIIPLHAMLRDLREVRTMAIPADKYSVTPPVQNTLKELVEGALKIANIGTQRLPTPQELLLQQQ